jgi:hypothetical protein
MKIFDQYQQTKAAVDILTAELAELKPRLIEELKANEGKVETKTAHFSLRSTKVYEFTPKLLLIENRVEDVISDHKKAIKQNQDAIKALKDQEIKEEKATVKSETFTPVMRVIKNK